MPAILRVWAKDIPSADNTAYKFGQLTSVGEQNAPMGFMQMPINPLGQFTVDEVNNNPTDPAIYSSIKLTDSGTVTKGSSQVDVSVGDVIVWLANFLPDGSIDPAGWHFENFGVRDDVPDYFYLIRITDKTVAEATEYLEEWRKTLEYSVQQYDPPTNNRRWTTTNARVSATGQNGFTQQGIEDSIALWNANHPANQATLVDTDNLTYFQCDGIMPPELFDEWQENTEEVALADLYARRRWYITQAGMTSIGNQAGWIAGTAAEVAPFLRDGLLD